MSSSKKLERVLNTLEVAYIKFYDSYKNGYNSSLGGEGTLGFKHSKETKIKMSNALKGRPVSKETRKKIGKANGRIIIQYTKDDKFIVEYESAVDASKSLNISRTGINNCCTGRSKSSGGFV